MGKEFVGGTCPSCGTDALTYQAGNRQLTCGACGFQMQLSDESFRVSEHPLAGNVQWERLEMGIPWAGARSYQCSSCKAIVGLDEVAEAAVCPFCLTENEVQEAELDKVATPWGIIPFNIPQQRALEILKAHIGQDWLYPRDLASFPQLERLQGVYVPFWGYKVATKASWHIFAGYKASEEQDEWKTEELRWVPKTVYSENAFDEIVIPASTGIKSDTLEALFELQNEESYKKILGSVVPFHERYLASFDCELYQKELDEGLQAVDQWVDERLKGICMERAYAEGIQEHIPMSFDHLPELSVNKQGLTFHHMLLPVWIAVYAYNGKKFPFVINGLNGKVVGEKPYDNHRVWIALGIAFVVLLLLVVVIDLFLSF